MIVTGVVYAIGQIGKTARAWILDRKRHAALMAAIIQSQAEAREATVQAASSNRKLENLIVHLEDNGAITPRPYRQVRSPDDPVTVIARSPIIKGTPE